MKPTAPPFPTGRPRTFRTTVHGTVFAGRDRLLKDLTPGDAVHLIPDPPGQDRPEVWVHLATGEPLGHLPTEISAWLAPWMLGGGRAAAKALKIASDEVPSWRRLVLLVSCSG
jgi:hypothetical protein